MEKEVEEEVEEVEEVDERHVRPGYGPVELPEIICVQRSYE